jgi:hypothetical protein
LGADWKLETLHHLDKVFADLNLNGGIKRIANPLEQAAGTDRRASPGPFRPKLRVASQPVRSLDRHMADVFTPEKRSEVMSRIRGRDTKPELALRSMLHRLGYRFTVKGPKNRSLPGKPDLVLPKYRRVVRRGGRPDEKVKDRSFKSMPLSVHDRPIRTKRHLHHILLHGDRILEVAFTIKKLLKPGHHPIGNLALRLKLGAEETNAVRGVDRVIG